MTYALLYMSVLNLTGRKIQYDDEKHVAHRQASRKYQAKQKLVKGLLAKLDTIPEFQQLSKKERKILADAMAVQLERFEKAMKAVMREWGAELEEGINRIRQERDQYLKVLLSQYARVADVKRVVRERMEGAKVRQHER